MAGSLDDRERLLTVQLGLADLTEEQPSRNRIPVSTFNGDYDQ